MDSTDLQALLILGPALCFAVLIWFVFPILVAFRASQKGRSGWTLATLFSILFGLGPYVALAALLVTRKLKLDYLEMSTHQLIEVLGRKNRQNRIEAISALGNEQHIAALDSLVKIVFNEHDPEARVEAANSLGWMCNKKAVEPLVTTLAKDSNQDVRIAAARSLGRIGDARATNKLIEALTSDKFVRSTAVNALGEIGDSRAIKPFISILQDRNISLEDPVRDQAAIALSRIYWTKNHEIDSETENLITDLRNKEVAMRTEDYWIGRQRVTHEGYDSVKDQVVGYAEWEDEYETRKVIRTLDYYLEKHTSG